MLLRSLNLKNIRSYQDETIHFPLGSILLTGEIGSGKSSLLLAIEFALFGTSRPDLPAEALLRKGAVSGSVELSFQLQGQDVTIFRALKKESGGIKQLPGYIELLGIRKELMPVELKAEILRLLGYPEDLLTKRNYIFRSTVYTPQEEMKQILRETPEVRQDALRRMFSLDKYKTIRENAQHYLRQLRLHLAQAKGETASLEPQQQQLRELQGQEKQAAQQLQGLEQPMQSLRQQLQKKLGEVSSAEQRSSQRQQLLQVYHRLQAVFQERQQQEKEASQRELLLQQQLQEMFPEDLSRPELEKHIAELDARRTDFISKKNFLLHRTSALLKEITSLDHGRQQLALQLAEKQPKENQLQQWKQQLENLQQVEERKAQLEELFQKTSTLIARNEAILEESQRIASTVGKLDACPTCQQAVSPSHKHSILTREGENMRRAEELLFEGKKKQQNIREQLHHCKQQQLEANDLMRCVQKSELELRQLEMRQQEAMGIDDRLRSLHLEMEQQRSQLSSLDEASLSLLQQELAQKRLQRESILKKEQKEEQLQHVRQQRDLIRRHLELGEQELRDTHVSLEQMPDPAGEIVVLREQLQQLLRDDKELSLQYARVQQQLLGIESHRQPLEKSIALLLVTQQKVLRYQEIIHWLEDFFISLTTIIEKHLFLQVHSLFNQLFQEWFSLLIDRESITASIDDSFTPLIQQNGYDLQFENISGGERTSAALAYRLALNKVMNTMIPTIRTKEIIILDEPTDGFSSEQLDKVRDVLECLNAGQTILVSHEAKIESFVENIIRIEKVGQESKVRRSF